MLVIDLQGLKSDDCSRTVQEAISARDPDAVVVVMRVAGRVSLDTTLTAEEAVEAIRGAGYGAMLAFAS